MRMLVTWSMSTRAIRRGAATVSVGALVGLAGCGDGGDDTDAVTDDEPTTTTTAPPPPPDEDPTPDASATWTQVTVDDPAPPPTSQAVLVAAPDGTLWLHGGRVDGEVVDDLWRFDGDTWEHLEVGGAAPAARDEHVGVWDEDQGRLIVATGQTTAQEVFDDVWAFDPSTHGWQLLAQGGPSARYGSCAVVDDQGRMLVSHGFSTQERFDDTWAFDLAQDSWAEVTPADGPRPAARCLHVCGWDADAAELVLFGGRTDDARHVGDTWRLGSDGWSEIAAEGPPSRVHAGGASTEAGFHVLGGQGPDGITADDWLLGEEVWTSTSDGAPSERHSHAIAERDSVVWVFGGIGDTGDLDDLWRLA